MGGIWAAAIVSAILFLGSGLLLGLSLLVNSLAAILILWKADGYAFYQGESEEKPCYPAEEESFPVAVFLSVSGRP